ncbi:hypothetical protein [Olivibacter sp. XZL3]|uniref:hypothetical protein n=1 Tax=Olivibacter sp. XZL3 TaxID=1735116 RepID=UPI0010658816|nr:hypothetical protein [Olivibacter sp. XZL3]
MSNLSKKQTDKEKEPVPTKQDKNAAKEANRSSITGRKIEEEDITGANPAGSAVKPDILREDHPGLAK